MFHGFMINTWEVATAVAVVAGVVGFFTVLRGSSFAAHALPNGAFAGAAGASLIGLNSLVGAGVFSLLGAAGISALSRRSRRDVATALAIVVMLGLGALFLSMTTEYGPQIYSLLFGELFGVGAYELLPTVLLGMVCVAAIAVLYRPLLLSSVLPDAAEVSGIRGMELAFLVVVALATTMAVPVVGALLIFSLLVSPAAAAGSFTNRPSTAMALSVAIALATVWTAIALSYLTNLPPGFFVGAIGAVTYAAGRSWMTLRGTTWGKGNALQSHVLVPARAGR